MGDLSGDKYETAHTRDLLEIQLMYNVLFIAKENIGDTDVAKIYFTQHHISRGSKTATGEIAPIDALTGTVAQDEKLELMHGGFDANTGFRFTNTGGGTLQFYTANLPGDPVPGTVLSIESGEETTAFASELGSEDNLFLMVYNPDMEIEGAYEVLDLAGE